MARVGHSTHGAFLLRTAAGGNFMLQSYVLSLYGNFSGNTLKLLAHMCRDCVSCLRVELFYLEGKNLDQGRVGHRIDGSGLVTMSDIVFFSNV